MNKQFYSKSVTEAIKLETCPQIALPGWWWKKYFSSYRRIRATMQDLIYYNWMHGGYEEYMDMLVHGTNLLIDQEFMKELPPINIKLEKLDFGEILTPGAIRTHEQHT